MRMDQVDIRSRKCSKCISLHLKSLISRIGQWPLSTNFIIATIQIARSGDAIKRMTCAWGFTTRKPIGVGCMDALMAVVSSPDAAWTRIILNARHAIAWKAGATNYRFWGSFGYVTALLLLKSLCLIPSASWCLAQCKNCQCGRVREIIKKAHKRR